MANPVLVAEMAKRAEKIFEMRDIPTGIRMDCRMSLTKSALQKEGDICESPPFVFCNGEWTLKLTRRRDWVDIHLNRHIMALNHENIVEFKLTTMKSNTKSHCLMTTHTVDKGNWNYFVIPAELLQSDQNDFYMIMSFLLKCDDCTPAAPVVYSKSHANQGGDLLDLLINGEESDVTINVQDHAFRVHKSIIQARSPTFLSMLKHDIVEKRNGSVDIPDYELEAFQRFLEYIPEN